MNRGFLISIILTTVALPAYAGVVINEVAWMGTTNAWQDEWIELYSDTSQVLDGWVLVTADGDTNIKLKNSISAGSYYLIERTNDDTVPGIKADVVTSFGSGGLENGGEILILKDAAGNEINKVDGSNSWAVGGNNETKGTLQKAASGWITKLGTPKASNGYEATPPPAPTPTSEPPALPPPPPLPLPQQTPPSSQRSPLYDQTNDIKPSGKMEAKPKKVKSKKTKDLASVSPPTSDASPLFTGEYLWLAIGLGVGILAGGLFLFAKRYFP